MMLFRYAIYVVRLPRSGSVDFRYSEARPDRPFGQGDPISMYGRCMPTIRQRRLLTVSD